MSLKVIIVAVIALIVLVILVFIFTGKTKIFARETGSCASRGGTCEYRCEQGYITQPGTDCDKENLKCCVPFEEEYP